jgi:hypothetical protein
VIQVEQSENECSSQGGAIMEWQEGDGEWEPGWDRRDERDHLILAIGVIRRGLDITVGGGLEDSLIGLHRRTGD